MASDTVVFEVAGDIPSQAEAVVEVTELESAPSITDMAGLSSCNDTKETPDVTEVTGAVKQLSENTDAIASLAMTESAEDTGPALEEPISEMQELAKFDVVPENGTKNQNSSPVATPNITSEKLDENIEGGKSKASEAAVEYIAEAVVEEATSEQPPSSKEPSTTATGSTPSSAQQTEEPDPAAFESISKPIAELLPPADKLTSAVTLEPSKTQHTTGAVGDCNHTVITHQEDLKSSSSFVGDVSGSSLLGLKYAGVGSKIKTYSMKCLMTLRQSPFSQVVPVDRLGSPGIEAIVNRNVLKRKNMDPDYLIAPPDNISNLAIVELDSVRNFKLMLDVLMPSTFRVVLKQMLQLPVQTEQELIQIMILVFEKAMNRPILCKVCAALCQAICKEYKVKKVNGEEVTFRKILLVRCQKELETVNKDDDMMVQKMQELEMGLEKAQSYDEKARLEKEFKAFQNKARERKLGYMRFLVELFLLHMLTPQIMNECMICLLKAHDEKNLEYLCKLWAVIGKTLDSNEKAKAYNDQIFKQMGKIASGESRNVRREIRCALWDVIELRDNDWVPQDTRHKTLHEIFAPFPIGRHGKEFLIDWYVPSCINPGRAPPMPNRNRRDEQKGRSHVKTGSQRVDPTKLKLTSQKVGGGELQLGPQKGFGGWGRGSSGSGKNNPPQQEERASAPANRFSALSQEPERNRMPMSRSGGSGQSRGGSNRMGTPRDSVEKKRSRAVEMLRLSRVSRGPSKESGVEGGTMRTPTPTRPAEVSVSSEGDNEQGYINSQKLEYTVATTEAATSQAQLSTSDIAAQLDKLLIEDSVANETVFDWVDSRLPVDVRQHPSFIRSLTTSIVQSCIDNNALQESKFKDRAPLLYKYYDSKPELELAALSAVEDLMTRLYHPPDLFIEFCYILSELELIADDSFYHWEKTSKNGLAVKSVGKFLAWLKENENR